MNKNPVFMIITALSVIGLVIAVGIFTRLRMQNDAAIQESQPAQAAVSSPAVNTEPAPAAPPAAAVQAHAEQVPVAEAPAAPAPAGAPAH